MARLPVPAEPRRRPACSERGGHAVRDLAMMEQGSATGQSANDGHAAVSCALRVVCPERGLIPTEGECRLGPRVDPEYGLGRASRSLQERIVEGHVLDAPERRRAQQRPVHSAEPVVGTIRGRTMREASGKGSVERDRTKPPLRF
jgi:hypothetical protein